MLKLTLSLIFAALTGVAQAQTQPQTPVPAQPAQEAGEKQPVTAKPSPLPGGASSIQETYQDWSVLCTAPNQVKQCTVQQVQSESQTNRFVLGVELRPVPDGGVTGRLVMPFGLQLSAGVTLALDQNPAGQPLQFQTCIPSGCLVPLTFQAATVAALKAGTQLKLNTKSLDANAKPLVFNISLKGFGNALERAVAIVK